ncbi:MAG: hypothetical protein F6K18_30160 [Okeania sp. SIO2C2]|uniref:hypothetical protein n=1 Tax=Okeania sp. SIO2C2 TaxID=2607787 RepID=UPI0013B893B2|nr:hypothetical protein [Okeania sp. SIO2C2]NEP90733.1 hypothetical protein [Okeania sp. SIO2C2]
MNEGLLWCFIGGFEEIFSTSITACTAITNKLIPIPVPSAVPIPKVESQPLEKKSSDIPRCLKINLTLSNLDDLKIKSRQMQAGEILSDRIGERRYC